MRRIVDSWDHSRVFPKSNNDDGHDDGKHFIVWQVKMGAIWFYCAKKCSSKTRGEPSARAPRVFLNCTFLRIIRQYRTIPST